jgi:hypothetical protein
MKVTILKTSIQGEGEQKCPQFSTLRWKLLDHNPGEVVLGSPSIWPAAILVCSLYLINDLCLV